MTEPIRTSRFGDRAPREPLKGNEEIIGGERVPVKRRIMKHHSDTHAWRGGDKPLRRKYRGTPHELETPPVRRNPRSSRIAKAARCRSSATAKRSRKWSRNAAPPGAALATGRTSERDDGRPPAPGRQTRQVPKRLAATRGAMTASLRAGMIAGRRTQFDRRDDRPLEAERPARPRQRRSFDRKSGPRPSRPRPRD